MIQDPFISQPVNPNDVNRVVSSLGSQSPYNVSNIISATTNPAPAYDYADPYGVRSSIEKRLGYGDALSSEEAARASLLGFQGQTRATVNALRANRDLSTGLEAGFESQRTREATQQEQTLADQLNLAQSRRLALESRVGQEFDIYQQERAKRESALLDALQYGAKVNIGMNLNDIVQAGVKAKNDYQKKIEKDAYKAEIKKQLIALGKSTKGLSSKEMEKKLKKYNKKALEEAKYQSAREWEMKVAQFNKSMAGRKPNELEATAEAFKRFGGDWGRTAEYLADQGFDVSSGSAIDTELRRRAGLPPIQYTTAPDGQFIEIID